MGATMPEHEPERDPDMPTGSLQERVAWLVGCAVAGDSIDAVTAMILREVVPAEVTDAEVIKLRTALTYAEDTLRSIEGCMHCYDDEGIPYLDTTAPARVAELGLRSVADALHGTQQEDQT
jgi:hypothetical protein